MRLKLIAMGILIASGASSVLIYELKRPMWSIGAAEERQRRLNSRLEPDDCGRWGVTRYPNGEGRVHYDTDHCPIPAPLQAEIWSKNRLIDASRSLNEIDTNIELLQEDLAMIRNHAWVEKQTK